MAEVGKARAGHEPDVTGADHRDAHSKTPEGDEDGGS